MTTTTVPGDPGGIRSAAGVLGETAEDAGAVIDRLRSLEGGSGDSMWRGPAADAFREKLGELPGKLVKLRDSYGIASDALYRFANDVDQLQDEASSAEQTETWAEDQVDFRERERDNAEASYPDADLTAYNQAIARARQKVSQAKAEVAQVKDSYRNAEDRCIASLGDASDAGIENTRFGTLRSLFAFVEKWAGRIVIVLLVLAAVALVIAAIFFGGWMAGIPAALLALKVAGLAGFVGGIATLGRWLLGDEVSASDLVFAVLALIPVGGIAVKLFSKAALLVRNSPKLLMAAYAMGKLLPAGWRKLAVWVKFLNKKHPGFSASVIDFITGVTDSIVGPAGAVTSLPGLLLRIFGPPTEDGADGPRTLVEPEPSGRTVPPGEAPQPSPSPTPRQQVPADPSPGDAPPPPRSGSPSPEPSPTVPPPEVGIPVDPGDGCVPDPGDGPVLPPPAPEPVPPSPVPPCPVDPALPPPWDGGGPWIDPELPIVVPVPVDPPEAPMIPENECDGAEPAPVEDRNWGSYDFSQPGEPVELISAGGPAGPSDGDPGSGLSGAGGREDRVGDRLDPAGSSAGTSAGGYAPGPQASWAPPPARGGESPAPPGPAADPGGPTSSVDVPDPSKVQLASARSKIPLGSPLLIGGLAAGGLVGAGAAYVITDARHRFRKEKEEEAEQLPQPVGLRF